jgi:hypothetical protein
VRSGDKIVLEDALPFVSGEEGGKWLDLWIQTDMDPDRFEVKILPEGAKIVVTQLRRWGRTHCAKIQWGSLVGWAPVRNLKESGKAEAEAEAETETQGAAQSLPQRPPTREEIRNQPPMVWWETQALGFGPSFLVFNRPEALRLEYNLDWEVWTLRSKHLGCSKPRENAEGCIEEFVGRVLEEGQTLVRALDRELTETQKKRKRAILSTLNISASGLDAPLRKTALTPFPVPFQCKHCGSVDHALLEGGLLSERLLRGIKFLIHRYSNGNFVASTRPEDQDYLAGLNQSKWIHEANFRAKREVAFECPSCHKKLKTNLRKKHHET